MQQYAKYLAWLHTPANEKDARSRFERFFKYSAHQPQQPPMRGGEAVGLLSDIGICTITPNGAMPLTWQELNAWQQCNGEKLSYWTLRILRDMSITYVTHLSKYRNKPADAPRIDSG